MSVRVLVTVRPGPTYQPDRAPCARCGIERNVSKRSDRKKNGLCRDCYQTDPMMRA